MAALVIRSLNILLGIFFTFLGTLKITPSISRDLHKDLRSEYAKFAKVLPGAKLAGVKVPSKWYRRGVGTVEIVCGELEPERSWHFCVWSVLVLYGCLDYRSRSHMILIKVLLTG